MVLKVILWILGILIGMFILCRLFDYHARWRDFNEDFKGRISDDHRIYLTLKEVKGIYPIGERWFWRKANSMSWCKEDVANIEFLWFDAGEIPEHELGINQRYTGCYSELRPTIYKVFLTFPAWVYITHQRKRESRETLSHKRFGQDARYLENKQVMISLLKSDIKKMEEQAQLEFEESKRLMDKVRENMMKVNL